MATLAERSAPRWIGMTFVVVHVRNRQDDLAAGFRVAFAVRGAAVRMLRSAFATISSTVED
jgi:hypothetical protein